MNSILYVSSYTYSSSVQVGRSGRFGHLGLAVNLITYEDRFNLYAFFCCVPESECVFVYWGMCCLVSYIFLAGIGLNKNLGLR